jgi:hypothetical protein
VVQLSTQHNPFWPSLDLERNKFDQPHSVQRSTAVPQARRDDLQEKIDDWQREKRSMGFMQKGEVSHPPTRSTSSSSIEDLSPPVQI